MYEIEGLYCALLNLSGVKSLGEDLQGLFYTASQALDDLTPEQRAEAELTGKLASED